MLERVTASSSVAALQLRSLSCFGQLAQEAESGGARCREAAVRDGFRSMCLGSQGIWALAAEPGAEPQLQPMLQVAASTNARLSCVLPSSLLRTQQSSPNSPVCNQLSQGLPGLLLSGREPEPWRLQTTVV